MFTSLIYVSRSRLVLPDQAGEVDRIVEQSLERNARLRVRGALAFTEKHFAQILEGPVAAIDELMASITNDPRHEQVTVASRVQGGRHRFPNWALVYCGGGVFMDGEVSRLLREPDEGYVGEVERLYALMPRLAMETRANGPVGRSTPR